MSKHLTNENPENPGTASTRENCEPSPDDLTESELKEYLELIKAAYPSPKSSIKDSVMAQIRNSGGEIIEQMPSDELCCAIVGAKPKKHRRINGRLLRYGGLAACLVIVSLVGIRVLPSYMGKSESIQPTADDEPASYNGLYDNNSDIMKKSAPFMLSSVADDGAISEDNSADESDFGEYSDVPEDDSCAADAMPDECKIEADSDGSYSDKEGAVSDNKIMFSMSGSSLYDTVYGLYKYTPENDCAHSSAFRNSYHDIPKAMINLVGEDEFNEWAHEVSAEDKCGVNIASFYEHFSGTDSDFSDEFVSLLLGDTAYYCDYPDAELFTEGRFDEIEEYYLNGGESEKAVCNYFEYKFKTALISKAGVTNYTSWLENCGINYMSDWSISDISGAFGFTADELREIYDSVKEKFLKEEFLTEYPDTVLFSYDFDKIAEDAENREKLSFESGSGCGILKDAGYRIYQ
ncbi:MAG: hypothetical protein ACI4XJ_01200 [Eubacteriales bacterium]